MQYKYLDIFPKELKSYYKVEEYTKNRKYKQALTKLTLVESTVSVFFGIFLFQQYNAIFKYFDSIQNHLIQAITFLASVYLLAYTIKLPFDYYKHFHIEQAYGFNNMTISLYLKDKVKWAIIVSLLFSIFLTLLNLVVHINIFYIWGAIVAFQLVVLYLGPYIMALFNDFMPCKDDLKTAISKMCLKVNYPLGGVYTMDQGQRSSHSNAFMYGMFKKYIVLFDTLLKQLNDNEIVAVLNHELGHWYYSHITKLVVHQCVWYLVICMLYPVFVHNVVQVAEYPFLKNELIRFLVYFQLLGPLTQVVEISQHAITRVFEYQADKFAFEHGYGLELCSALDKLMRENLQVYSHWLYALTKESHPRALERLFVIKAMLSDKKKN